MKIRLLLLLIPAALLFSSCEDPFYPDSERLPMIKFTDPEKWYVELSVCDNLGSYINIHCSHTFLSDFNPSKYYPVKPGTYSIAYKARNTWGSWYGWYVIVNNYQFQNGKKYNVVYTNPTANVYEGRIEVIVEN